MKKTFFILYFVAGLTLPSCYKDKTAVVDPNACDTVISYSQDIVPIINQSCISGQGAGCHEAWIQDYVNVAAQIDAGNWQNVVWINMTMPKIPNSYGILPLTEAELKTMRCWVDQGYPNN